MLFDGQLCQVPLVYPGLRQVLAPRGRLGLSGCAALVAETNRRVASPCSLCIVHGVTFSQNQRLPFSSRSLSLSLCEPLRFLNVATPRM